METQENLCRYRLDDGSQCSNPKSSHSSFCEQHADWLQADLEVYRAVTEHFRQDVREFWVRSNFYLLVQAGLLSVFATSLSSTAPSLHQKVIFTVLGILGLVIAIIWFIVLRGAALWIRRWREQTIALDEVVDRHRVYSKVESFAHSNPLMSPTHVSQYLPLVFCLCWIALIFISNWLS